jgi:outer membrane protein TolC
MKKIQSKINERTVLMRNLNFLMLILVVFFLTGKTFAQQQLHSNSGKETSASFEADGFLEKLPPVEILIDSAISHAPGIKSQDISMKKSKLDMQHARNNWTNDLVNAGGVINYGKLNDLYLADNSSVGQVAATTSTQTRYSVGVTVKLPVSALFNHYDYKAAKIELEQTENQKQLLVNELREEVMSRYNSLVSNYLAYKILFESFDDQEIIVQHAEKDFLTNQISISDLSNIRVSYAKAKVDMSRARYDFQKSLWLLEEVVGFKIRG